MKNKLSEILASGKEEANRMQTPKIDIRHLMLAILKEKSGKVANVLNKLNVNVMQFQTQLEKAAYMNDTARGESLEHSYLSPESFNVVKRAAWVANNRKKQLVEVDDLFLAMLHNDEDNPVKSMLNASGVSYDNVEQSLASTPSHQPTDGIDMPDEEDEMPWSEEDGEMDNGGGAATGNGGRINPFGGSASRNNTATRHKKGNEGKSILEHFSHDLTRAAAEGKLDPIVGREAEINRMVEVLCRRKKNNPVLIGEPGVGKSSLAEGLAQMIVDHKVSPILFNKRVIALDMTSVVAGTKYRGQFEERIKAIIKEIEEDPNIIIFIDEIHTIIGAGSAEGSMDAANILKPALARGTIQCIGATTLDEYRKSIEKDGALERRFQKIILEPTTPEDTLNILHNIRDRYEQFHHVSYTDDALTACVRLAQRYITDRAFPDKAIDILDEAGAKVHLGNAAVPEDIVKKEEDIKTAIERKNAAVANQNFELAAAFRDRQTTLEAELEEMKRQWTSGESEERATVDVADIENVVARISGVPVQKLVEKENVRLRNMEETLKASVVAQDDAISKVCRAVQRNRIGLKDANRPIGVFMFLGPTGVGKTYLAKKLADFMFGTPDSIIRIDMSEYNESFSSSRLVGAPPGYVGYDEGGQLTEKVRRHPYSIVLLDEIEKAHGNIFNMLLQVLDEGRMTDGNGRLIDFRNTIIIMTSNAGTRQLKEFGRGVGFNAGDVTGISLNDSDKEHARSIVQKSLSKQFAPEFLNRLDEIITFDQLDLEAIKKIVDIEMKPVSKRIEDIGYTMHISDKAKDFVATKGYDVQFGARPLRRAIQTYIEDGICNLIINDDLTPGSIIYVDKEDDKSELSFSTKMIENTQTEVKDIEEEKEATNEEKTEA